MKRTSLGHSNMTLGLLGFPNNLPDHWPLTEKANERKMMSSAQVIRLYNDYCNI